MTLEWHETASKTVTNTVVKVTDREAEYYADLPLGMTALEASEDFIENCSPEYQFCDDSEVDVEVIHYAGGAA